MAARVTIWVLLLALHIPSVLDRMMALRVHTPRSLDVIAGFGLFLGPFLQVAAFVITGLVMLASKEMRRDPVIWGITVVGAAVLVGWFVGPTWFRA